MSATVPVPAMEAQPAAGTPNGVSPVLKTVIPTWDTDTHPADPWEDDTTPMHQGRLRTSGQMLEMLIPLASPAWHIALDRTLYFCWQKEREARRPDLVVFPCKLADAYGAVRYDIPTAKRPPPPLWILEIASISTAARDLDIKQAQYRQLGVTEYWIYSPAGPLPDQPSPLCGWAWTTGAWQAVPVKWDPKHQIWHGYSPVWQWELCAPVPDPAALWDTDYPGPFLQDPKTGRPTLSYQEQATIIQKQATIQKLHAERREQLVLLMEVHSGTFWAEHLRHTLEQIVPTRYPAASPMRAWLSEHNNGRDCLNAVRTALDLDPWPSRD